MENLVCDYISWNKPKLGEKFVEGEDVSEIEKESKKVSGKKKTTTKKNSKKKK